ncbi:MAG: DUF4129 domain-containing protein [Acidimicrobiales bacterium]
MSAEYVLGVAAGLAAVMGLFMMTVGVVVRRAPLREFGLAALVGAVVLAAVRGPGDGGRWVMVVAPAVAGLGELARLTSDLWRRSHHQHVERSAIKATGLSVAVVVALGAALSLLGRSLPGSLWPHTIPDGTIPDSTVPAGMIPIGTAMVVGVVAASAWGLRRLGRRRQAARRPVLALSAAVIGLAVGTTALASGARATLPASGTGSSQGGAGFGSGGTGGPSVEEVVRPRDRVLPQLPTLEDRSALAVLVLAVLVLVVLVILTRRMQLMPPEDLVPDPVARVPLEAIGGAPLQVQTVDRAVTVAVLDEALVELRQDADPRVAVRLAYAVVTRGLGDASLARRPAESEGEYLQRALMQLGAGAAPLRELTELFWRARFSDEPIDEPMRAAALAALEQIRAQVELRPTAMSGRASDRGAGQP